MSVECGGELVEWRVGEDVGTGPVLDYIKSLNKATNLYITVPLQRSVTCPSDICSLRGSL